jgi:hypothetical protein
VVFFTPFHIAFHLKKKLPPNGLGLYFQWQAQNKEKKGKKKGVDGHDREVERV